MQNLLVKKMTFVMIYIHEWLFFYLLVFQVFKTR